MGGGVTFLRPAHQTKIRPLTLVRKDFKKDIEKYIEKIFKNNYFYFQKILTNDTRDYIHFSRPF